MNPITTREPIDKVKVILLGMIILLAVRIHIDEKEFKEYKASALPVTRGGIKVVDFWGKQYVTLLAPATEIDSTTMTVYMGGSR